MEIFMQSSYMCLAVYICGRWNGSSALLGYRMAVWECGCGWGSPAVWRPFDIAFVTAFYQILNFFFLLKLSAVCTFWIVLMCWCQKWFLKNEKTSLACISAWKAIWKTTATTLPNTLLKDDIAVCLSLYIINFFTEFSRFWAPQKFRLQPYRHYGSRWGREMGNRVMILYYVHNSSWNKDRVHVIRESKMINEVALSSVCLLSRYKYTKIYSRDKKNIFFLYFFILF